MFYFFNRPQRKKSSVWTPAKIPNFYYLDVNTADLWTDAAATVPAAVNDNIYHADFNFGPAALRVSQPTSGARPFLRQDINGFRYLEGGAGFELLSSTTFTKTSNGSFVAASSGSPSDGHVSNFGLLGAYNLRIYGSVSEGIAAQDQDWHLWYKPPVTFNKTSRIGQVDGSTVLYYSDGADQAPLITFNSPENTTVKTDVIAIAIGGGAWYGFGFRYGGGLLTNKQLTALDTYQKGLYGG